MFAVKHSSASAPSRVRATDGKIHGVTRSGLEKQAPREGDSGHGRGGEPRHNAWLPDTVKELPLGERLVHLRAPVRGRVAHVGDSLVLADDDAVGA
jgi:hypothetical protein